MKIGIACDHRGYEIKNKLKEYLESENYVVVDYGTNDETPVDYPVYAFKVGEAVRDKNIDFGIIICRTGIGMSIACNKVAHVRCAKVDSCEEAKLTRIDNNSNVIALGYTKTIEELKEIIKTFLETKFECEERHARRIEMIDKYNA